MSSSSSGGTWASRFGCLAFVFLLLAAALGCCGFGGLVVEGLGSGHQANWYLGGSAPTQWPVTAQVSAEAEPTWVGHYDIAGGFDAGEPLYYAVCAFQRTGAYGGGSPLLAYYGRNRGVTTPVEATRVHAFPRFIPAGGRTTHGDFEVGFRVYGLATVVVGPKKAGEPIEKTLGCECGPNTAGYAALCAPQKVQEAAATPAVEESPPTPTPEELRAVEAKAKAAEEGKTAAEAKAKAAEEAKEEAEKAAAEANSQLRLARVIAPALFATNLVLVFAWGLLVWWRRRHPTP